MSDSVLIEIGCEELPSSCQTERPREQRRDRTTPLGRSG